MRKSRYNRKRNHSQCKRSKHLIKQTMIKFIKSGRDRCIEMANIRIKRQALYQLMHQLCDKPIESGGILLGPAGTRDITHFYFDQGAACTGSSYSPDYRTLNRKLREEWEPAGLQLRGFVHSHPGSLDRLTDGDMNYIKRLLTKNCDMNTFIAPIVLPNQHAIHPYVVSRDRMDRAQRSYFEIFD
jgi:proteasome lid subunit RPN8/RPN11